MEHTLVILKPEALEKRTLGSVMWYWDEAGFDLVAAKVGTAPPEK